MIIGFIFSVIKRALALFIKAIAWVLFVLALWVPFLYSVIFIIVCALASLEWPDVSNMFFFGLTLSIIASFFISGYLYERRRKSKKKSPVTPMPEVKPKEDEAAFVHKSTPLPQSQQAQPQPAQEQTQQAPAYTVQPVAAPPPPAHYGFYVYPHMPGPPQSVFDTPVAESLNFHPYPALTAHPAPQSPSGFTVYGAEAVTSAAEPRVFATRSDPTVFVYEYPDRIDFYKRTRQGMVFMNSRPRS